MGYSFSENGFHPYGNRYCETNPTETRMPNNDSPGSTAVAFLASPAAPRILPFATLMILIGVEELLRSLATRGAVAIPDEWFLFFYPVRIAIAGVVLVFCMKRCEEVRLADLANPGRTALTVATGLMVFVLWINMDWLLPFQSPPPGFNPLLIENDSARISMISFRLFGAAVVIPLLEELFWRSFLLRFIIDTDFEKVPVGSLTLPAFMFSTILFGLEHHYIVAGMMAGAIYTTLLRYTGSIALCSLAHAVTNLALGIYVITRHAWQFW